MKVQKEIYQLIQESDRYNGSNDIKSLELAKKASLIAEKDGTSRDKAISYTFIANALTNLGMYKESFTYLEKSLKEEYSKTDVLHEIAIKLIMSDNYCKLNLNDQAFKELNEILKLADKNPKNHNAIFFKAQAIRGIGENYSEIGKLDSALIYLNYSAKVFKDFSKKDPVVNYFELPSTYLVMGQTFLKQQKGDSALYYLKKGFQLIKKDKEASFDKFYTSFGNYYYQKKEYSQALDYYLKSIHEMEVNQINDIDSRIAVFKIIYKIYGLLNEPDKREIYFNKYVNESEKLSAESKENLQKAVEHIMNEKQSEISFIKRRNNIWILSIVIIVITICAVFYTIFRKINRKKGEAISKLEIREIIITEKEEQTKKLRQKLNENFDEIIELAKKNHPHFYTRFQEVYPEFQKKLLFVNPNLKNSELILLAYCYLNFKTKEIADYTFKAPRTIQNRKHLLRKKLNIPATEDLSVWLKFESD